jgi:hypothetical protein
MRAVLTSFNNARLAIVRFEGSRPLETVAVGTIISDRPPHRSVRALISAYGSYLG